MVSDDKGRGTEAEALILLKHTAFSRISHWVGAFLLMLALISGLYIGNPAFFGGGISMRMARIAHLGVNGVLTGVVLARVYYALVTGDIQHFLPRRGDVRRFAHLMKYYLFLSKDTPYQETKYNVGQRLIFLSWFFGWLFLAITGLILASPERMVSAARFIGDLQTIRLFRYLITVYFAMTIIVHIYLSTTSDPAKLQAIFSGYVRVKDGKSKPKEVK